MPFQCRSCDEDVQSCECSVQSGSCKCPIDNFPEFRPARKSWKCCRIRYLVTCMCFWGLFLVYSMRVNLSVTIIAMVNNTAIHSKDVAPVTQICSMYNKTQDNQTYNYEKDGEFLWDQKTQSYILNAFFYGYILTQLPGGYLAQTFSAKWVFGLGVFLTSALTLLTSWVVHYSASAFIALRVFEGITEGVTYPSMYALLAHWVPLQERGALLSFANIGSTVGTFVTLPVAAFLSEYGFAGGWPSVFYVFGTLGCLWFFVWIFVVADSPERHYFISAAEKEFIIQNRKAKFGVRRHVPWFQMLTSMPLWMCALVKFSSSWSFYTLLTELPTYLKNVLYFKMEKNGLLNASIYLSQAIFGVSCAALSDFLTTKGHLRITPSRKIFQCTALFGIAACLIGIPLAGCNWITVSALLIMASTVQGATCGGEVVLPLDLAPEFAGSVQSIANLVGNTAGIFAPLVVGYLTENNDSISQWNKVFYLAALVSIIGGLIFALFGSAEVQPWALSADDRGMQVDPDQEGLLPADLNSDSDENTSQKESQSIY